MKFKKLSLGLGLVFGAFAVASLTSCSGSTKVTYKDDAGNEKTVDVKKTNNKDEVAEAATAIVYSEGDKTFKPTGVSVSVSADARASGKEGSGIGLSIAREIVLRHKGTITAFGDNQGMFNIKIILQ